MINNDGVAFSWRDFHSLFASKFGCSFNGIEDLADAITKRYSRDVWQSLPSWADMEDLAIFRVVFNANLLSGDVVVVADSSFGQNKHPFLVNAANLESFVQRFLQQHQECLFNGDTVFVGVETKSICFFHHEGVYCHVVLNRD